MDEAWSQEEPVQDYPEPRSRITTSALLTFVGVLAVLTVWLTAKLLTDGYHSTVVAQQQQDVPASSITIGAAAPTYEIPDVPNAGVVDRDTRYVNLLGSRGVTVPNKAAGVDSAMSLCQAKIDGYTQQQMIAAVVQANPKLDAWQAPVVVSTAIETYCP